MLNKRVSTVFIFTVFFCMIATSMSWAENNGVGVGHSPGELLIKLKAGVNADEVFKAHGAIVVKEMPQIKVKLIKVPDHALETVKEALGKNPNIEFVEYNFMAKEHIVPNDPYYQYQWFLPNISAEEGWNISTGSEEVIIAILDSGIAHEHPDLVDKIVPGWNFLENNDNTNDVKGHGTAVAGSAAASTNNVIGIAGTSWESMIMPLLVANSDGWTFYDDAAEAVIYATDNGAKIINMSFGGAGSSYTLQNAIDYAWERGVVIVASAGNDLNDTLNYPASCNNVISVSATNSINELAFFSSYGTAIDVTAPGQAIYTTSLYSGNYGSVDGTSFSSPIVAGLAGLIWAITPNLTNAQVVALIEQNADDLGEKGWDIYFGHGKINIYNTLIAASGEIPDPPPPTDITNPVVEAISPEHGSTVSGVITIEVEASDDVGVAYVEFIATTTLLATIETPPYTITWDTTTIEDTNIAMIVKAYDDSGNMGQVEGGWVLGIDNTLPEATFVSPVDGVTVSKLVKVVATASDTGYNGKIMRMRLLVDGVVKFDRAVSTLKYGLNTRKITSGEHTLVVEAYDRAGNIGIDTITITK